MTIGIGITNTFCQDVLDLPANTWQSNRESFIFSKMEKLVGKLSQIDQAYRPTYYLMPQLYDSVGFCQMLKTIKQQATSAEDALEINIAIKAVAK